MAPRPLTGPIANSLFDIWVKSTPEERERQLDEAREIASQLRTDGIERLEDIETFEHIIEVLEDWHEELS